MISPSLRCFGGAGAAAELGGPGAGIGRTRGASRACAFRSSDSSTGRMSPGSGGTVIIASRLPLFLDKNQHGRFTDLRVHVGPLQLLVAPVEQGVGGNTLLDERQCITHRNRQAVPLDKAFGEGLGG